MRTTICNVERLPHIEASSTNKRRARAIMLPVLQFYSTAEKPDHENRMIYASCISCVDLGVGVLPFQL